MKILYGIQGTGNGHLARARALVPELRKAGIEMDFVFSGRAREDFFNMDVFGDSFRVFKGLSLITEKGHLKTFKTATQNNLIQFFRDASSMDVSEYDLVISDFEPVTAWAAKLARKTCLGISHQSAFHYNVPKVRGYLSAKLLMKLFAPTSHKVGLHWHHFNQAILPPLIEPQIAKPIIKSKILVYMGFEDIDDIVTFLGPFTDYNFWVYAKVNERIDHGHIQIKPLSHTEFHHDLEDCEGVISNAGFELSSECLALGKKLLIKPLHGQYEQLCNALALQVLKKATIIQSMDHAALKPWLEQEPGTAINYPNVAEHIANWIKQGQWHDQSELVRQLWQDSNIPSIQNNDLLEKIVYA